MPPISEANAPRSSRPLGADLLRALDAGELEAWYQPVIRLSDGVLSGFEAFARWPHRNGGVTLAAEILALAQECGLLARVDESVRRDVFRQVALWQRDALVSPGFHVGLKTSAADLDETSAGRIVSDMEAASVDPRGLVFELVDAGGVPDVDVVREFVIELRWRGAEVALDGTGNGTARFDLLLSLPVDVVKIDRSLVEASDTPNGVALALGLVKFGDDLQLRTIAAGVETLDQADRLRLLGCRDGQGYLWMPAVPAAEAERLLTECQPVSPHPSHDPIVSFSGHEMRR